MMSDRKYSYGKWMDELAEKIVRAADEMERVCQEGNYTLRGHLESYDLLEALWLLDNFQEQTDLVVKHVTEEEFNQLKEDLNTAIARFNSSYDSCHEQLQSYYDQEKLEADAAGFMQPWKEKVERAEKRLEKQKKLHAVAARASEVFQGHNFFKKWLMLGKVRKEAGFKLNRKRVCNFAAKTFDLVNEAQAELNQARNGLHNSNVTYKCIGDLYPRIHRELANISGILLK